MTNTNDTPAAEIAALEAGLAEVKRNGPYAPQSNLGKKLASMRPKGEAKLIRSNIWITAHEWGLRNLLSHIMTMHLGRPVGQALIVRLGLRVLAAEAQRSLKDPVVAARLKAELMAVRENRQS